MSEVHIDEQFGSSLTYGTPLQEGFIDIRNTEGVLVYDGGQMRFHPLREEDDIYGIIAVLYYDGNEVGRTELLLDDGQAIFEFPTYMRNGDPMTLEITFVLDPNSEKAAVALALSGENVAEYALKRTDYTVCF